MWLLDTREKQLWLFHEHTPPYAILSHMWGSEEVTPQELQTLSAYRDQSPPHPSASKVGYRKIEACCEHAIHDGFDWVWIDTCCIDKASSAELLATFNSMFRWYKESNVCYVFLEDVSAERGLQDSPNAPDTYSMHEFCTSKWFTRGWTLQELLAPDELQFFSKSWSLISDRSSLRHGSALIRGPQDLVFKALHVDASLNSAINNDHIYMYGSDISETPHNSPTSRIAYFHC